ncbi:hypothetical protein Tco_1456187 [Tanacetum coccineum]
MDRRHQVNLVRDFIYIILRLETQERISKKRTKNEAKTRHGMEKHKKDKVKSKPKSKKSTVKVKADNEEYLIEKKFGKTSGNSSTNMPLSRRQLAYLEEMLQKEKAEFEESLQKLLFQSYSWDDRLVHATSVNINSPRDDINDLILENMVRPNETLVDVKSPVDSDASEQKYEEAFTYALQRSDV